MITSEISWRHSSAADQRGSMVGADQKSPSIAEVLTDNQVCHIVKKCIGETARWQLIGSELKPAVGEGIAGFLGDHFRLALTVKVGDSVVPIPLFVKTLPLINSPKATFIDENNFFRREMVIFKLMEEMETGGSIPWGARAVLYNESRIVMHDLAVQGYSTRDNLQTLDLAHVRAALAAAARFHAAAAGRDARRSRARGRPCCVLDDYADIFEEQNFKDTPWIRAGAKLTKNLIDAFSSKYKDAPDLEAKLLTQFLQACEDIKVYDDTLNVIVHKDLWVNNIMFKYENGEPSNAIILDFQCVRYAPPAFDVMTFLYLTTSRSFRENHESEVLGYYFKVFIDSLDADTRVRVESLGYDYASFLRWVEKSRRFGMLEAVMILPYVLMNPTMAQDAFDDPATFLKHTNEDRSAPVLAEARRSGVYRDRQLEVCEEFIERYLV